MTLPIVLPALGPAQAHGWRVVLGLHACVGDGWCLIGGQMVWLLAAEHGVVPPRSVALRLMLGD